VKIKSYNLSGNLIVEIQFTYIRYTNLHPIDTTSKVFQYYTKENVLVILQRKQFLTKFKFIFFNAVSVHIVLCSIVLTLKMMDMYVVMIYPTQYCSKLKRL